MVEQSRLHSFILFTIFPHSFFPIVSPHCFMSYSVKVCITCNTDAKLQTILQKEKVIIWKSIFFIYLVFCFGTMLLLKILISMETFSLCSPLICFHGILLLTVFHFLQPGHFQDHSYDIISAFQVFVPVCFFLGLTLFWSYNITLCFFSFNVLWIHCHLRFRIYIMNLYVNFGASWLTSPQCLWDHTCAHWFCLSGWVSY